MGESKHTPGPWTHLRSKAPVDGEYDFAISAPGVPVIAEAFGRSADGGFPPTEANARLIAAAPELAETLAWVRANYASGSTAEINKRIDAALAKAGA